MSVSSREDFRRRKELEEARKAGTIPAEVDEEGNEINPHIPRYIAQAPWYIDSGQPSLKHQKLGKDGASIYTGDEEKFGNWYQRGVKQGLSSTKYRKGACENCGSMTHKTRECLERPRKLGAKWTGKDIAPDEVVRQVELSFDAKRDRWNGYDGQDHMELIEEWELIEEARKKLKQQEADQNFLNKTSEISNHIDGKFVDDGGDEDKYAEASDMPGQKVDLKTRTTVRNLRIREDTAKYLRNLDPSSAYYDPKTRRCVESDMDKDPSELVYAGDNFVRASGDVSNFARIQLFAWEAAEKGHDVHTLATPSQTELFYKQTIENKSKAREIEKQTIFEKYGGEEHLDAPPPELLMAHTEQYVEYSRTGKVIKGQEKTFQVRSRYEEDVYINNHTSVWGSFWQEGRWGYACCHQFLKNSYCIGKAGIEATITQDERLNEPDTVASIGSSENQDRHPPSSSSTQLSDEPCRTSKSSRTQTKSSSTSSDRLSSNPLPTSHQKSTDSPKTNQLMEGWQSIAERERPYVSSLLDSGIDELTEEQLETYRLKRIHTADPMRDYLSKQE